MQDWRFVIIKNGKLVFSGKCGATGTRTKSGKPRLCLPFKVLQKLNRTQLGREALKEQVRAKLRAELGERVRWNPIIKMEFDRFNRKDTRRDFKQFKLF